MTAPTVQITEQTLSIDTGVSATDGVTSDGTVTLTGTFTGAAGTIVSVVDGSTTLGTAIISGNNWTYTTTLASGTHTLHAVATANGQTATSAAEPAIIVDTSPPAVTFTSDSVSGSTMTASGTVESSPGTTVQVFDATVDLGNATLNGSGGWTFSATLAPGSHVLHAVAVDLAGNTASTATQPVLNVANTLMAHQATKAAAFIDSIGVNAHIDWNTQGWLNAQNVENAVAYLGVKNIRDGVPYGWVLPEYEAIAATGVRFDLIESGPNINAASDLSYDNALELASPGSIETVEGDNEYNTNYYTLDGQSSNGNLAWGALDDQDLQSALQADPTLLNAGVKVLAASTSSVSSAPTVTPYVGVSNWHVYAGPGQQLADNLAAGIADAEATAPGKPVYISETGIASSGYGSSDWGVTDLPTQGIIDTNAVLDGYNDGAAVTFIYELMNDSSASDQEDNFGLFNADGTPKPAATDIHNLISILSDPGAASFQPGTLNYTISGLPSTASSMLLQKSGGAFDIVIWNGDAALYNGTSDVTPPTSALTVTLGGSYQVDVYDPIRGTTAIQTLVNTSTVSVGLSEDPLILEVLPAVPTVVFASQVLAADTGASPSDRVTSNGAVTLSGTFSGAPGTVVTIVDGTNTLGTAATSGNVWSYTATLAAGVHLLHAVATDTYGQAAASAVQPAITVDATPPAVTFASEAVNGTTVTASGTVETAGGTGVQLFDGSTGLGAATLNGSGGWTFSATLAPGTHSLHAVATDLAGNTTTTASQAPLTVLPAQTGKTTSTSAATLTGLSIVAAASANVALASGARSAVIVDTQTAPATTSISGFAAGTGGDVLRLAGSTSQQVTVSDYGFAAILWDNGSGAPSLWQTDGSSVTSASFAGTAMTGYHVAAIGDFNGDGLSDVLWTPDGSTGYSIIWLMNGSSVASAAYLPYLPVLGKAIVGDFNGDGKSDILWEDNFGAPLLWTMNGSTITGVQFAGVAMPGYHIATTGDFDGNGTSGIMWASNTPGGRAIEWSMSRGTVTSAAFMPFPAVSENAWSGDFNGDGRDDILWDMGSGAPVLWTMNGTGVASVNYIGTAMPGYRIAGIGADGDGRTDIIWTTLKAGTGPSIIWQTNGSTVVSATAIGSAGLQANAFIGTFTLSGAKVSAGNGDSVILDGVNKRALTASNIQLTGTTDSYAGSAAGVSTNLASGTSSVASDSLAGYENLTGSAFTDALTGDSGNNILNGGGGANTLTGNGGYDTYQFAAGDTTDTILNQSSANAGPSGELDMAFLSDQLWLVRSGSDLVVDVLGTTRQAVIKNWYSGDATAQLDHVVDSAGMKLDAQLQQLVQAMAAFGSAHTDFSVTSTAHASLGNSYFSTLATAVSSAWHG